MQSNRVNFLLVVILCCWPGLFLSLTSIGQCPISNNIFTDGETISYVISYSWGPIWVDAGIVTFSTKLDQKQNKPAWHLISTGRTFKSYDFLFKVRDTYETWIDTNNLQTIEFQRYIYEGDFQMQSKSWFDYSRRLVFSNIKINDNSILVDTIRMIDCTYDMLSAVYHVRSLDLDTSAKGDTIPVYIVLDDSTYRIDIMMQGKEIIEHPDGKLYKCNKLSATMVEGTIFSKGQEAIVWVSDDPNKIPIYIEAKILVGSVKAYLNKVTGLKYPLAIVKN